MRRLTVALSLCVFLVTACQSEEVPPTLIPTAPPPTTAVASDTPEPTPTASPTPPTIPAEFAEVPENQASLRVVHAMLDGVDVDVYVEARAIALRLQPGLFTNSVGIEAGEYTVRIQESGQRLHQVDPFIQQVVNIEAGEAAVLVFTGSPDTPAFAEYGENLQAISGEQSRVQFINAVPRSPLINLLLNGQEVISGVDFGQLSASAVVDSGDYAVTAQTFDGTLINYSSRLNPRFSYTYILTGRAEDIENAEFIEFRSPVPGASTIRMVNGARDVGVIDVYINDGALSNNLLYGSASGRQQYETGAKTVKVFAAGQDPTTAEALVQFQFNTNPDDDVTLVLVGTPESLRVVRHDEDLSPVAPGDFAISFMNALPIGQRVRVEMLGEETALERIPDLNYTQVSPRTTINADTYDFFWSVYENDVQGATLETATGVMFEGGKSYLYLMTGQEEEQPLIVSEDVEEDEMVAILAAGPTPTPIPPTTIRVINLIETGNPVDVILNDVPTVTNLPIGQASETFTLLETFQTVVVRLSGTLTDITSIEVDFDPGDYNIYVAGRSANSADTYIVENNLPTIMLEDRALIRLYNTSFTTDAVFNLHYGLSAEMQAAPTADPTTEAELSRFRGLLPAGTTRFIQSVSPEVASPYSAMPLGIHDFFITDARDNTLAASLRNIDIQPGKVYEVVAFQAASSPAVTALVVSYDEP